MMPSLANNHGFVGGKKRIAFIDLGRVGPSVVSINGVVASLAATEFMLCATGTREPRQLNPSRFSKGGN